MPRRLVLVATLALLWLCACGRPGVAQAATVWIEVSPSTVAAGDTINVRAQCGEPDQTAVAASEAFGQVTMHMVANRLNAEAQVPVSAAAARYLVTLRCPSGRTASTSLFVTSGTDASGAPANEDTPASSGTATVGPATMGPHTGGGFLATGGPRSLGNPLVWLIAGMGAFLVATVAALRPGRPRRRPGSRRRQHSPRRWPRREPQERRQLPAHPGRRARRRPPAQARPVG
ncbi:MAG TPA: hypothetical protein VF163_03400 [Micromonosporaceae bacterium]